MREMLRLAIEQKYSDAEIIEFADGDEAWSYLSCHSPDLFISDGLHPGAMGLELLRRLADSKSGVPMFCCFRVEVSLLENIALVSGYDSLRVRVLPKPFKIDKFYEGIEELLEPMGTTKASNHESDEKPNTDPSQ
jgi:DNA-binding response OmpR family regulator